MIPIPITSIKSVTKMSLRAVEEELDFMFRENTINFEVLKCIKG
jgi:hypothetical protein